MIDTGTDSLPDCSDVASLLIAHAAEVVDRWAAVAVVEQPNADPAYRKDMRDHLPGYVQAIGQELTVGRDGGQSLNALARLHGADRWQLGWKPAEVLRDYHILRRVLVEFLEQRLEVSLQVGHVTVINRFLDAGMIAAAASFSQHTENRWRELNEGLEKTVDERTAQLRRLSLHLVQTEQREREKLARMLHDGLQQILTAAKLQLAAHRAQLDRSSGSSAQDKLQTIGDLLDQSIKATRTLSVELAPPILFTQGLPAALLWLGEWMGEMHGLVVTVRTDARAAGPDLDAVRTVLFEIARELLFNVVKHSGVRRALVELERPDDQHVRLIVSDKGKGFTLDADQTLPQPANTWGLAMVRERVQALGGQLTVTRPPSGGARVSAELSIHPE